MFTSRFTVYAILISFNMHSSDVGLVVALVSPQEFKKSRSGPWPKRLCNARYTHSHTDACIYIYIYICVCVCVCVCVCKYMYIYMYIYIYIRTWAIGHTCTNIHVH